MELDWKKALPIKLTRSWVDNTLEMRSSLFLAG